ncbi:P-loop containing nucleoside triphosphate hydrolase protein [Coniochaeta sp. 2T2.1]|nr:P-loop containing nucleoside triphosphate hydrolase protein [Coniochaeta sp. 2T2.1]
MAPKELIHAERCIPAGCIVIKLSDTQIPPGLYSVPDFRRWLRLTVSDSSPPDPLLADTPALPRDLQKYLVSSFPRPWTQLLNHRWVEMAFRISVNNTSHGILRVYLLPDDIERRDVDRSEKSLRRARLALLARLDFLRETWNGYYGSHRLQDPVAFDDDDRANDEDQSLLHMFNNITPPEPKPELIQDHYAQDAAHEVLVDSEVVGLKSPLYFYQQRSCAVMLQRESQPIRVLDPRLVKVKDQHGHAWYYDRVNGCGLLEPRLYDGVNGGILAEEMGAGKTLICIALILATKHQTSQVPEIYQGDVIRRPKIGSLADMAAAHINKRSLPWKPWFGPDGHYEFDYQNCRKYLQRNPGYYYMPRPERRKTTRQPVAPLPQRKVYLSYATLVIVPGNLIQQWKQEIAKHTVPGSLRLLVFTASQHKIPPPEELIETDILLFSTSAFERLRLTEDTDHPLTSIHFKRCIIDEGHRLGASTPHAKSNLLLALDILQLSARWVVTGTPAKGLVGVDQSQGTPYRNIVFSDTQEKDDLKRIGAITTLYLRARPWANTVTDYGDKPAEWSIYVLQPKHSNRSNGRKDCLRATLDSLIIRHPLHLVAHLLPDVDQKVVVLEGSYQDRLALNLFSMAIAVNAVTSNRVGPDYFFSARQRKSLAQLVSNLKQASFFGGPFHSIEEISSSIENAVTFLEDRKIPVSQGDESLLLEAIAVGRTALTNVIKPCSKIYGEVPLYVKDFPGGLGAAWSLDESPGDPVLTNGHFILHMQKYLRNISGDSLQIFFETGKFEREGRELPTARSPKSGRQAASNRTSGTSRRLSATKYTPSRMDRLDNEGAVDQTVAEPLRKACIISTASAKMTYLIDEIVKYQKDEKIIIFYEEDNIAWYITYLLEILDIRYLVYSGTVKVERRAQYITSFNHNPNLRVMLMDIGHAAFGLNLQSASRIYFINPVLDPQIEFQAIGRARRISQQKPVTVRTLVLKGSLEELIVERKNELSPAEQRQIKSIVDDKPIKNWIQHPKFLPLPEREIDGLAQTSMLQQPQRIFYPGYGRTIAKDEDVLPLQASPAGHDASFTALILNAQDGIPIHEQVRRASSVEAANALMQLPFNHIGGSGPNGVSSSRKRAFDAPNGPDTPLSFFPTVNGDSGTAIDTPSRPSRRVRFSDDD